MVILKNEKLTAKVAIHGAELKSVVDNVTGYEYMWQADPEFWGRTSPVLFPVVGKYVDGESIYNGVTYKMGQHGFARDMDFEAVEESEAEKAAFGDDTALFVLTENEDTLTKYPFAFKLSIRYVLKDRDIKVIWKVTNPGDETMYFSIGAHPAFNCNSDEDVLILDTDKTLQVNVLNDKGALTDRVKEVSVGSDGSLPMSAGLFSEDALILENEQIHEVTVSKKDGTGLVKVSFTAPLCGIWSPVGKHAPFVCIEPWYGRADRADFSKKLEEREYGNTLVPGDTFEKEYSISFIG